MRYFTFLILFAFGFSSLGFAAGGRDIVAYKMREHALKGDKTQPPSAKPKKKGSKKAKSSEQPKQEEKKSSSGSSKSSSKKKDEKADSDKPKDDKKEEKKEEPKKEEAKKKKKVSDKKKEKQPRPKRFYPENNPFEPVFLNDEQNRSVDELVQEGKVEDAEQIFVQNRAALHVNDVGGVDQLESSGLPKGVVATELMTYLHGKKDKVPFTVHADPETREYLSQFIQDHATELWVADDGEKLELSFKGHVVGNAGRHPAGKARAKDTLEQMISLRAMEGRRVPMQFKVVNGENNKPAIQAYFNDEADADSLARFVGGVVQADPYSDKYYVKLQEGMSKKLIPTDGEWDQYYANLTHSLQRSAIQSS